MQCINCSPVLHCVYFGNRPFCYYKQQCTIKPCPTIPDIPIIHDPGPLGPVEMSSNSPAIMSYSTGPSYFARCMQITGGDFYTCQRICRPIYQ